MKKVLFSFHTLLSVLLISALVLSACGAGGNSGNAKASNSGESGADTKKEERQIGMVTDASGVNDNSFNQGAWSGLQQLGETEKNVKVKYLESKSNADYETNVNNFVKQGWDLTYGIGFPLEEAIKKVSMANPDSNFAIIDSNLGGEIPANVVGVTFKEEQGSFLVGVIAGLTTKTNKVGFIGGMDSATINRFEIGFKAGVKTSNPDAEIATAYVGSFGAPDLGKQNAATMYDQGADIIFHASGGTGDGLFNEAIERKKAGKEVWVIGVDMDQSLRFGEEVTLTSMIKRVDNAVIQISKDFLEGNFQGGKEVQYGLNENGVSIADTSSVNVAADILERVTQYRQEIIDGKIVVPRTHDEFDKQFP